LFTDWRTDPDELLAGPGTAVAAVLALRLGSGVMVRGLVWRSHPDQARFSQQENLRFADDINAAGGEVVRGRAGAAAEATTKAVRDPPRCRCRQGRGVRGRHRPGARPSGRRSDGDRQAIAWIRVTVPRRRGTTFRWMRGPAVGDLEHTFCERWTIHWPLPADRGVAG
jgi:hypothetical protein